MVDTTSVFVPSDTVSMAIQQMQLFGWRLVGQESTEYRGEPCHKLNFIRALDQLSLDRIRELEEQYPFGGLPEVPDSNRYKGKGKLLAVLGTIVFAFGCVGTVMPFLDLVFPLGLQYPEWFSFPVTFGGAIIGLVLLAVWLRGKRSETQRNAKRLRAREEVEGKRAAIEMELRELLQHSSNSS